VVLHFPPPAADRRRQLIDRWHPDLRAALDLDRVIADTDGLSFAEIDELRNLLVMRFTDTGAWDWGWATAQYEANRRESGGRRRKGRVGFAAAANGSH
jgi:hypothetical protein